MIDEYLDLCRGLIDTVSAQENAIAKAAGLFSETILAGRMVHLFGSGHSRILVEEMWPRYGSFPGFNPIVELSLSFHNQVVGANGQRQAMFLENVHGLAGRILRNFETTPQDCALIASSSGCNLVPIEMAEEFKRRGIKVVAILSKAHSEASRSQRRDGRKLQDFADIILDTGAPVGDAMIEIPGLETPVGPGSTIGGCLLINAIKVEVAALLTEAGHPPTVLTAPVLVGRDRSEDLFDRAYDEHGRRLSKLYATLGESAPASRPVGRSEGRGVNRTDRTDPSEPAPRGDRSDSVSRERREPRESRSNRGGGDESRGRLDSERGRSDDRSIRRTPDVESAREVRPAREPREPRPAREARPARDAREIEEPRRQAEPVVRQEVPPPIVPQSQEVLKPSNWDRMDDIERRMWLRENGQAPSAPSGGRSADSRGRGSEAGGSSDGQRRPERRGGRDSSRR